MENQGEKEKLLEQLEKNLDNIYFYLDLNFESMSKEEKQIWLKILENLDKNFHENKDSDD